MTDAAFGYLLMCVTSWRYINSGWGQTLRVALEKPKVRSRAAVEPPELANA